LVMVPPLPLLFLEFILISKLHIKSLESDAKILDDLDPLDVCEGRSGPGMTKPSNISLIFDPVQHPDSDVDEAERDCGAARRVMCVSQLVRTAGEVQNFRFFGLLLSSLLRLCACAGQPNEV
jgi:hypothetical protein